MFVRAAGERGGIATNHETLACAFKSSQLVLHPQLGPQLEPSALVRHPIVLGDENKCVEPHVHTYRQKSQERQTC